MKKFLFGILVGVIGMTFGITLSGCNHHDRHKTKIYITPEPDGEVTPCYIIYCHRGCEVCHVHHWWHPGHQDDGDNYCGDEEEGNEKGNEQDQS